MEHHTSNENPEMISLMGYTIAKESGQIKEGIALCEKAISLNPHQCEHYLSLGRIYLLAGKKEHAIKIFKKGLKIRKDSRLIHELRSLGVRKPPVFGSFHRDHALNVAAGKLLRILRLR
jgi:tetratricopeptide (TPR) repeat protein